MAAGQNKSKSSTQVLRQHVDRMCGAWRCFLAPATEAAPREFATAPCRHSLGTVQLHILSPFYNPFALKNIDPIFAFKTKSEFKTTALYASSLPHFSILNWPMYLSQEFRQKRGLSAQNLNLEQSMHLEFGINSAFSSRVETFMYLVIMVGAPQHTSELLDALAQNLSLVCRA